MRLFAALGLRPGVWAAILDIDKSAGVEDLILGTFLCDSTSLSLEIFSGVMLLVTTEVKVIPRFCGPFKGDGASPLRTVLDTRSMSLFEAVVYSLRFLS